MVAPEEREASELAKRENIERAVALVDGLSDISEDDRRRLKILIPKAAKGDESALTDIILFPYQFADREIYSEIFLLILTK